MGVAVAFKKIVAKKAAVGFWAAFPELGSGAVFGGAVAGGERYPSIISSF